MGHIHAAAMAEYAKDAAGAKAAKPACAAPRQAARIDRRGWSRPPSLAFFVSI